MNADKLHIVICALGMPFNEKTIAERSLGGSETAAYYQARELARRGHQVDLWTNIDHDSKDELGVRYTAAGAASPQFPLGERFERWAMSVPHDVLIIQRHPLAFHKKWAAKVCLWQLHDLALHRTTGAAYQGLWQVNAVTVVSQWHKQQVIDVWGVKADAIKVVPNGVNPGLYDGENNAITIARGDFPHLSYDSSDAMLYVPHGKFLMLYQSRPERGLEHLVRPGGIMDRLKGTRAHLLVCAYANTVPQMAHKYAEWDAMAKALPNVTNLGALTKAQLAALQKSCDLLCYPTEFEEVSCITAMEAMHAGLPMLTTNAGVLEETCAHTGTRIIPLTNGKVDEEAFVNYISRRLEDSVFAMNEDEWMENGQRSGAQLYTWANAVDKLEQVLYDEYRAARTPERMIRYGFEHSDLELANESIGYKTASRDVMNELRLYEFAQTPEGYAAHYAKHQGIYYDDHEEKVIGEDVTQTSRFKGVVSYLAMHQERIGYTEDKRPLPMRVLDFGCAHGHYLMRLAQWLPQSEFFGIDISERAIGAAMKWAMRDRITNVTLAIGGLEHADGWATPAVEYFDEAEGNAVRESQVVHDMRFDAIIAGEVLEHVPDPFALAQQLLTYLKPGGVLIGTTPVGRWEWSGTKAYREAREHLWHFTKQDLERMFEDYAHDITYAGAGTDQTGELLGSYVFSVTQHELACVRRPTVEERLAPVVPRQTISACLIVKDGEQTLRRCILSFIDWVDELIIGIDPLTTDRTEHVIELIQRDYPLKRIIWFEGRAATIDGFDAARNAVLDKAIGDWVLWLDADEEVRDPANLWKYAKSSAIDGIGLPQVHYSCAPAQVLTTDFPTRMFRRSSKARFFGLVHEHPEVETGKAVPNTVVRHDAQFLHSGYVDEPTRRRRYDRNVPLLKRDLEKYPERSLNKFLIIRDLTQGVMFDLERTGGNVLESHAADARRVIVLFDELLAAKSHVRLLVDALEFYSQAVAVLGEGFEAKFSLDVSKPGAETLNVKTEVKGRFLTRDVYFKFLNRLAEEATVHYESKHL